MALTDENSGLNVSMPVAPAYGMVGNGGIGWGGGDWSWIIILFLFGIFGGGWGGMGGFGMDGGLYPWLNNSQNITAGFGDIQTALCGGFAGVNATINGAQNAISQQLYSNELASLNRSFAEQTANTAGFTSTAAGIADLRYTVATEACADRAAISDALKDVLAANTASTQKILDQMCQDKIDAKNDEIARLRQEINMQTLAASQAAQNAFIQQGFSNEVDQLYNRLSNCPVPSTPVYGRTPIFTCNNSGCGCGNGFAN